MNFINEILSKKDHRTFEYPNKPWRYYQEWNRVLFLHYEVSLDILKNIVPHDLTIDTFNGKTYISIVPFTMEKIRPRFLPSINYISNFHEINVRTYVEVGDKKGVYFLNIEAQKYLSVAISKGLSGLPYEKSNICRNGTYYSSNNIPKKFHLTTDYLIGEAIFTKSDLDVWLTERYCLYVDINDSIYRYDIHHKEWSLKKVSLTNLNLNYKIKDLIINESPKLTHYSDGIKVLAWNKVKL